MQVFDTPGSVSLQVRLPSGRVVVTTVDEPRTSVEIVSTGRRGSDAPDEIEVSAEQRHDGHVVRIEQKDRIRWGPIQISWGSFEVRVTCPPGSNLELSGGSADLQVDGPLGEVEVRTASGDVKLEDVVSLAAKTASGDVSVGSIAGRSSAGTVSGDIRIAAIEDELVTRSVSGDIRVGAMRARLAVSTTSGDVAVDSVEAGELRMQSVSGDARIAVGRGTRVWIDAVSVSGTLGSELGVSDDAAGEGEDEEGSVVPLHVKTVSGDLQIVRASVVSS
jgi:hypothetical protein